MTVRRRRSYWRCCLFHNLIVGPPWGWMTRASSTAPTSTAKSMLTIGSESATSKASVPAQTMGVWSRPYPKGPAGGEEGVIGILAPSVPLD